MRLHIIFKGEVQGVGFRYTLSLLADKYHLTGTVENLSDGSVEAFIQGDDKDIEDCILNISDPTRFFNIKDIIKKVLCALTNLKESLNLYSAQI